MLDPADMLWGPLLPFNTVQLLGLAFFQAQALCSEVAGRSVVPPPVSWLAALFYTVTGIPDTAPVHNLQGKQQPKPKRANQHRAKGRAGSRKQKKA